MVMGIAPTRRNCNFERRCEHVGDTFDTLTRFVHFPTPMKCLHQLLDCWKESNGHLVESFAKLRMCCPTEILTVTSEARYDVRVNVKSVELNVCSEIQFGNHAVSADSEGNSNSIGSSRTTRRGRSVNVS